MDEGASTMDVRGEGHINSGGEDTCSAGGENQRDDAPPLDVGAPSTTAAGKSAGGNGTTGDADGGGGGSGLGSGGRDGDDTRVGHAVVVDSVERDTQEHGSTTDSRHPRRDSLEHSQEHVCGPSAGLSSGTANSMGRKNTSGSGTDVDVGTNSGFAVIISGGPPLPPSKAEALQDPGSPTHVLVLDVDGGGAGSGQAPQWPTSSAEESKWMPDWAFYLLVFGTAGAVALTGLLIWWLRPCGGPSKSSPWETSADGIRGPTVVYSATAPHAGSMGGSSSDHVAEEQSGTKHADSSSTTTTSSEEVPLIRASTRSKRSASRRGSKSKRKKRSKSKKAELERRKSQEAAVRASRRYSDSAASSVMSEV
ncbi:unnamed protein product [Amoebophrya sp. A25]|nr:unnamed protein product [Amoebophrya sp. A25]|eukprot:GSA25T00008915001.1